MKIFIKGLSKRVMSLVLCLMMLVSLCTVGFVSASAATTDLAESGASVTFAAGDYIYIKNFKPSGWSANWFASNVYEWMHLFNSSTQATYDAMFELIDGTENATGAIYGAKITQAGTFDRVIFTRAGGSTSPWDDERNRTGEISISSTFNCYTNLSVGGTSYTGSNYTNFKGDFWADVDGDVTTTEDAIYVEGGKMYLPSADVTFFTSEGTLTIDGKTVTTTGTKIDLASGTYNLGGDFSGSIKVLRSANVSSIHTTTKVSVPQGTYQGYEHKDDYETKGTILVFDENGTRLNTKDNILKKIKGRGNSSWEASHKIIGKYAFNITLESKAKLLDESEKSKKFCLVSYNADEARMRNMIVYELAQQIKVNYVPDYQPVDFYNNGKYIGSYLLTDKVEIGNPLVDIVNLDDINEMLGTVDEDNGPYGTNYSIYDADDISSYRGYKNGNKDTQATKGFYKYVNLEEPDPKLYADSGFLLEFELLDRFPDEISGFISNKGQQIVCKYPEYASKAQIEFIMGKWNTAEALMYSKSSTYEQLDAVIDVESFAKMYLIQELTKNLDGGATSFYVYYHEGKLHAGVAWDYDWTLGQYAKTYSQRTISSSDFYGQVNANPSDSGGWYLNSKGIYKGQEAASSVLNAQAALCQNDAFWSVVVAEWNEIFYSEAMKFPTSMESGGSDLELPTAANSIITQFYNMVAASTIMDEDKWGLIKKDPFVTNNWGSKDTGDTHLDAVEWLDEWMYDRIMWMDKYLNPDNDEYPNTAPYNVDYTIQPPTVKADKEVYAVGDTVTLTIDDKTDGNYTYTIFRDGVEIGTTTSRTYSFTAEKAIAGDYTVKAESTASGKVSAVSDEAVVAIEGFILKLDVKAQDEVMVGDIIHIQSETNADTEVTFTLQDDQGNTIQSNKTGEFFIQTLAEDSGKTFSYKLIASTVVDGETFTKEQKIEVKVNPFQFAVSLSAPASVEAGMVIILNATAVSNSTVKYKFYTEDGTLITENTSGVYSIDATSEDIGKTKSFYVVASTVVAGTEFTATSDIKKIQITEVKEMYDVTVYFKSTSTIGYRPVITTSGAVQNKTDFSMEKSDMIASKNISQTSTFFWYKADVQVSKASPSLTVNVVLSSRYAMEATLTFTVTQSGPVYLGVDNLNSGVEMINMTTWTEAERNWTKSAVHSVYDKDIDGEESLAEVAANVNLVSVGDANGDGIVNIKDATLIQKFLANLESFNVFNKTISDVTDDGRVTIKDATAIQKKIAGCL